jgi:hypothetical protein
MAEVWHNPECPFVIGLCKPIYDMGFSVSINGSDFTEVPNTDLYLTEDIDYLMSLQGEELVFNNFSCTNFSHLRTIRVRVYTGDVYTIKVNNGTKESIPSSSKLLALV